MDCPRFVQSAPSGVSPSVRRRVRNCDFLSTGDVSMADGRDSGCSVPRPAQFRTDGWKSLIKCALSECSQRQMRSQSR